MRAWRLDIGSYVTYWHPLFGRSYGRVTAIYPHPISTGVDVMDTRGRKCQTLNWTPA